MLQQKQSTKPLNVRSTPYTKNNVTYLRLRWTTSRAERKELLVSTQIPDFANLAKLVSMQITNDYTKGVYDETLQKYKLMLAGSKRESFPANLNAFTGSVTKSIPDSNKAEKTARTSLCDWFEEFMLHRHQAKNPSQYYFWCKQMLLNWEKKKRVSLDSVPDLLLNENYSARTYNERRGLLMQFFDWCIAKKKIAENPLATSYSMSSKNHDNPARKPFTVEEMQAILVALKTNKFVPKSSHYTHSQYYSFVYFMALTGVRNAEAIGLQCKKINFETGYITIDQALARTLTSSNASARKLKETKNGKTRYLPMSEDLRTLMHQICACKNPDDYLFTTHNDLPIDDKAFQRRVWKLILKELKIVHRDLYALRHTFATKAVKAGLKPQEVADLMGDRLDTVIENYYHSDYKALALPSILPNLSMQIA